MIELRGDCDNLANDPPALAPWPTYPSPRNADISAGGAIGSCATRTRAPELIFGGRVVVFTGSPEDGALCADAQLERIVMNENIKIDCSMMFLFAKV